MNYYKITNKSECEKEVQFKDGLIEDSLDGITFAKEDILSLLMGGYWIRKVKLPKGEKKYKVSKKPVKFKAKRVILGKRKKISLEVLKQLLKEGAKIKQGMDIPLLWAVHNGNISVAKFLIKKNKKSNHQALIWACSRKNIKLVKCFLENHFDTQINKALNIACSFGPLELVKLIVSHGADINRGALLNAAENGKLEIVKFLVGKGVNVNADCSALYYASYYNHREVIEYLEECALKQKVNKQIGRFAGL